MARKNKSNAAEVVNAVAENETFSLVDAQMSENNAAVAEVETPTGDVGTVAKNKKNKGVVKARDNGFRVLQTVESSPDRIAVSEFTGRVKAVADDKVIELADSIRKFGQLQAVQVTRLAPGGTHDFTCVFGHTRLAAIEKLRTGYTSAEGKLIEANPNVTVRAEVVDADDQTIMLHKIVENEFREGTNAIDKAKNQQILREQFGMSDVKIAEYCNYASSATVSRLKKLLTLEQPYQNAIADGTMTANAGFLLADKVESADREAVFASAVEFAGGEDNVGESAVKKAIVAHKQKAKEAAATQTNTAPDTTASNAGPTAEGESNAEGTVTAEPGERKPRKGDLALSMKDFKEQLQAIAADNRCPDIVKTAMGLILDLQAGSTDGKTFAQWFAGNLK
jgi:ParB-like chromosome segregation protein Spo0J